MKNKKDKRDWIIIEFSVGIQYFLLVPIDEQAQTLLNIFFFK